MSLFSEIDRLKEELDTYRPLPTETIQSLKKDFLVKNTYHSNAIEGNTLTIYETKAILEDGVTVGGKSLREHLEIINHREASLYMEEHLHQPLSEKFIKDTHAIVLAGIDREAAGTYRKEEVQISGASHKVTPSYHIPAEMNNLMKWYEESEKLHPVERASLLHSQFVNIHPFRDGNGRTARLLLNFVLLSSGYLPIMFKVENRIKYYEALDIAGFKGNYQPFISMVTELERESLNQYLELISKK
ncbi:Fic family protein [Halalkalibacter oceani]|uniref:Fic family protein n=1 Tax=Halalkalibacter oceani TaxID=1653776 RepID=A0A9X2DVX6_9BACI|nr:Fic family protein [Halalkalibacter oceani]MCM3716395.1 Fic family protein [Halalkalibacter oceani]